MAQGAGARLIRHLTSSEEELHKHNRGIGMPVRASLYGATQRDRNNKATTLEMRSELPYREHLIKIADVQRKLAIAEKNLADAREKCRQQIAR